MSSPNASVDPRAVTAPEVSASSGVRVEQWSALCTNDACTSQRVTACFSSPLDTWSAELAELVHGKLDETAANTAFRAHAPGTLSLRSVHDEADGSMRDLDGDGLAARTFVAFTPSPNTVHACFVLAIEGPHEDALRTEWVHHARILGPFSQPPSTSLALGATSTVVHHPKQAFASTVAALVVMGALVIARRPGRRRQRH